MVQTLALRRPKISMQTFFLREFSCLGYRRKARPICAMHVWRNFCPIWDGGKILMSPVCVHCHQSPQRIIHVTWCQTYMLRTPLRVARSSWTGAGLACHNNWQVVLGRPKPPCRPQYWDSTVIEKGSRCSEYNLVRERGSLCTDFSVAATRVRDFTSSRRLIDIIGVDNCVLNFITVSATYPHYSG